MRFSTRGLIAFVCAAVVAAAASSALLMTGHVQAEDRNHDGRSDLWRFYNGRGQLIRVAIDTNFDGRSDEQEYYSRGVLVRRERDRNMDDRIDLIETFDAISHELTRTLVDVDFNGVADQLVLFRNGLPVYTEHLAPPSGKVRSNVVAVARSGRDPQGQLLPLLDPSRGDAALTTIAAPDSDSIVALASFIGLPGRRFDFLTNITGSRASPPPVFGHQPAQTSPYLTRGPPVSVI